MDMESLHAEKEIGILSISLRKTSAKVGVIRRINTRGCPLCGNLILGLVSNAHYPSIHPSRVAVRQHIDRCITES